MRTTYLIGRVPREIEMPSGGKVIVVAEDTYRKALKAAAKAMRQAEGQ